MEKKTIYLGVLANLQEKKGVKGPYLSGWLDSLDTKSAFFKQYSLTDKGQVSELSNGRLLFFETALKRVEGRDRLDGANCYLAEADQLRDYFLSLDEQFQLRIDKKTPSALLVALRRAVDGLIANTTLPQEQAKLTDIRSRLVPVADAPTRPEPSVPNPRTAAKTLSANNIEGSFLQHVLTSNSPEYALKLFPLLVEGIRAINTEDSFKQALFLLDFNKSLSQGKIPNIKAVFYSLANREYRFQFWLQGIVPYCDPRVLLSELELAPEDLRQQIVSRCQAIDGVKTAFAVDSPTVNAYFSNIRSAILEELNRAQNLVQVAVAWFTNDEMFTVLCNKLQENVRVELIINNDYINNWEYGLPFEKFIALGGQLYLSEHPAMMHHKFCIIDDSVLFNGSYNWTYYAERYNEENVLLIKQDSHTVSEFKAAFEGIKQRLGQPAKAFTRLDANALPRFERVAFREYLSKDIQSRVAYNTAHKNPDMQLMAKLMDKAVEIDNQNSEAQQLQKSTNQRAAVDEHIIQTQQIVNEVLDKSVLTDLNSVTHQVPKPSMSTEVNGAPVSDESPQILPLVKDEPKASVSVTTPKTADLPSDKVQASPAQPPRPPVSTSVPNGNAGQNVASSAPKPAGSSTTEPRSTSPAAVGPTPLNTSTLPLNQQNGSISIPETRRKEAYYENLQVILAIDYSGSMESTHKLYSSGKVQEAVNMIFGIGKALTTSGTIDVFKFHKTAIPLPEVTDSNYSTYVNDVVQKGELGGTDIYAPIQAIHTKYNSIPKNTTNVFVILITDGENEKGSDEKMRAYFTENKSQPIFWQFVGLGNHFAFLKQIAEQSSNIAFFNFTDSRSLSSNSLLESVLQKFPLWFKQAKEQGHAR